MQTGVDGDTSLAFGVRASDVQKVSGMGGMNSFNYGNSTGTKAADKSKNSSVNSAAVHQAGLNSLAGSNDEASSTEQNCCINPTLAFNLAKGFTISAGAVAITIGYVANGIFSSAHEPVWAGKAYGLSGGTFTISDIRIEALTTPVKERMGQSGSYTITFDGGYKYHGKGPIDRMFTSAIFQMGVNHRTATSFNWTPSATDREAFKAEYRRMQTDMTRQYPQGYRNPINYNKIQSPGYLYIQQDGY